MVQARMENAILTVINVVVHLYYICIRFIVVFYMVVRVHVHAHTLTHTRARSYFLFLSVSLLAFVRNCFGSSFYLVISFSRICLLHRHMHVCIRMKDSSLHVYSVH